MSSGFISESEIAEKRKCRQEEWEKVRKPDQPLEAPEEEYDHRSLFDRLQEQKQKRDFEYEEAHRLKNMIKGLDDDEVEFLELVDRSKLEEERKQRGEEQRELASFRSARATLSLHTPATILNIPKPPTPANNRNSYTSQTKLLAGAVVKKRPTTADEQKSSSPPSPHQSHPLHPPRKPKLMTLINQLT
ncbi:PSME3-interacting protein isoform X2 [Nilaparvata lugens]|uniref:PSME3-interacting protein isoform X2 n=1 Tax=Nilaparvata lugens TaxID=108931 RepID=UPI00193DA88A|nr:PSME3-interacting protein isoform X2 [Nilaparvata lugens]